MLLVALTALTTLPGCHADRTLDVTPLVVQGEYGRARIYIRDHLTHKRDKREYMLDRMQLGVLTLADGYAQSADVVFEEVYDILRTQGINADKTVDAVVFSEDVKFWKGEPFEQALTFAYVSMQQAMLGQWDNARAAAGNALFNLRDFSGDFENKTTTQIDAEAIARKAMEHELKQKGREVPEREKDYLNSGYAVRESNFALGYLLHGIASQQLGREQEANDYFAVAANINRELRPLVDALMAGQYNTILVVSFGLGPRKAAYGPDNALARFEPRFRSDNSPLIVRVPGQSGAPASLPVVCDVNRMAADHMWNNLEDVRRAKSLIGTGLLAGGAAVTAIGIDQESKEAALVGIGMMAVGAMMKAGAHADTRYCNVMPQRMYIVPVHVGAAGATVELEVAGYRQSRLVLPDLSPPPPGQGAKLRYVRLVSGYPTTHGYPAQWAATGNVVYSNDHSGAVTDNPVPYILGGRDVRTPSPALIPSYRHDPRLATLTPAELENLYRDRGVFLAAQDQRGYAGRHILEGGDSLVPPLDGTAGFARLFCQPHPPFRPPRK